jgi:2-methylisocitrate lyase-like PEP mutase family enzyme
MNVLAGPNTPSVPELKALGVRRVTVGSGFAKAALTLVQKRILVSDGATRRSLQGRILY